MLKLLLTLHFFTAFLSLVLLIFKGRYQMTERNWRENRALKIIPHISDTLLILSGIGLFFLSQTGLPWWLMIKLGLLLEYVIFSAKYFSRKSPPKTDTFFYLALLCFSSAVLLGFYH